MTDVIAASVVVVNEETIEVSATVVGIRGPAGPAGPAGPGVPDGGTTGEVLAKASDTDQDTEWVDGVASVFGRTGVVVAESGDYTPDQVGADAAGTADAALTAAESYIDTQVGTEASARLAADTALASALTSETSRAESVEGGIESDLATETTRAETAEALKANSADLAAVATSGEYGDLLSLPTLGSLATVTPTGTPDGTKFLRDDDTWAAAGGAGIGVDITTYGATTARAVYDGACTSGSATVTSATAAFVSGDVGKEVLLADTSAHVFVGTIQTVNSATSVTLTANCTFTGTGVALAVGADCTTAIQNAVNDVVAAGGGTIYFPGAGKNAIYLVLGAQQTGSVTGTGISAGNTWNYSGQILFPANDFYTKSMVPIRFLSGMPSAQATIRSVLAGPPDTGVVLLSSATSGKVFDAIPNPVAPGTFAAASAMTDIHAFFENIVVRTCVGQPVTALGCATLVGLNLASVVVGVFTGSTLVFTSASPSSIGVDSPRTGNEGSLHYRNYSVNCYGVGITTTEHTDSDGGYIQCCKVAVLLMGGGHLNKFEKGCIQHCQTMFKSNSGTTSRLIGDCSFEQGTGGSSFVVIDDINGAIKGTLTLACGDNPTLSGLPVNGGWGVNLRYISGAFPDYSLLGSTDQPVREDFTRINPSTTSLQATGISNHIYEPGVSNGPNGVSGGKGTPTSSGYGTVVVRCPFPSVVVRSRITLSATAASIGVTPRDKQVSQTTVAVLLEKDGSHDNISITKWDGATLTTLATLASAGLTLGATYELSVEWDQPIKNGPAVITVYLDGVQKLIYTLTSGDQALFGSPVCVGLAQNMHAIHDAGDSRWLDFYAFPGGGAIAEAYTDVETTRAETAEALLAPLASPALTGNPTVPTQTAGNNSTRAASTAFVQTAVAGAAGTITANTQTASYTLVLTDAGLVVEINNASANTLTIPPNSSVAFPLGTVIEVFQLGAGQCTITAGAGVTLRSDGAKVKTAAQYATVGLRQRATDEWVLTGDLA